MLLRAGHLFCLPDRDIMELEEKDAGGGVMERPDERTLSPEAKEYITYLENRLENMSAMYRNLQRHISETRAKNRSRRLCSRRTVSS